MTPRRLVLAVGTLIVLAGLTACYWRVGVEHAQMRTDLLIRARLVAKTIDPEQILGLTGSSADLHSPAYLRFKERLALLRHADPRIRFIYLAGLQTNGTPFFLVDSESPESEAYSPPGQVYDEASEAFKAAFLLPRGTVEGPNSDRWGTWVSALVPVMNPGSRKPLALLGMDVDARNWTYDIFVQSLPLAAMTLMFATASALFYLLLRNSESARLRLAGSETRLSESEGRYRIAARNTGQIVYDVHLASGKILWLGAIEEVTGYSPEEFAQVGSRGWMERIHPEDRVRTLTLRDQAIAAGSTFVADYRFQRKDGGFAAIAERGSFTTRPGSPEAHLIGVMEDVTAQKRAEAALRDSEGNYRRIIETAKEGIWMTDAELRITFVNPHMTQILGYSAAEMIGTALRAFMFEEDLPDLEKRAESRRNFVSEVYERRYRRKDGSTCWVLVSAAPLMDPAGGFAGSLGMMTDITERKLAEKSLRVSEFRFRSLIDSYPDIVVLMDLDGNVTETNRSLTRITGFAPQEFIGRHYRDFLPQRYHETTHQAVESVVKGVRVDEVIDIGFTKKDGARISLRIRGWAVTDEDGRPVAIGAFVQDVTSQRQLIEEKETLKTQLQQAQKMEAIGTLAGGIAHDFNNILSVIMGNAEILECSESTDPPSRACLASILSASRRAKKLVGQILAFSRREKRDKILLNLPDVVKETLTFLRASLPPNIELRHSADPGMRTVLADPTQMQQVLMNLCTNAMHAIGDENGVLEIKLTGAALSEKDIRFDPEAEPGEFLRLSVSDTGHGMDPLTLQRIFEPYFTTKPQGKGTGLGLATVHGIVTSHGGLVRVESEVGRGTSFHVFLPRAEGAQRETAAPSPPLPAGSERILFVDDEPALAELAHKMLSRLGYRVETRTSPVEALEAFRPDPWRFDLVITDLAMPQMPGLKLARHLTELRPELPVIICTGFSDTIHEEGARAIGVRGILHKPLAMRDLAQAIRKALDRKG